MRHLNAQPTFAAALCLMVLGCGDAADDGPSRDEQLAKLPYAKSVVSFEPGEGAGHGQTELPDIVVGPPGSPTQVLSLGAGGEIVLAFGDRHIEDGPGADFVVFENAFATTAEDDGVWEELAEVSVSSDGEEWTTFACDTAPSDDGQWPGCAGWQPVEDFDPLAVDPLVPEQVGGDAFDLADIGVEQARYVRIRDLSEEPNDPNAAGFDLNAVGLIHHAGGTDAAP